VFQVPLVRLLIAELSFRIAELSFRIACYFNMMCTYYCVLFAGFVLVVVGTMAPDKRTVLLMSAY